MTKTKRATGRTKGRSLPASDAAIEAGVTAWRNTHRLTPGGLTAAQATAGVLTADQLAKVCGVQPRHIERWTANGWLPFQIEQDGTLLYRLTCIAVIEAMFEMADCVKDDATLHRNLAYLRDRMPELWSGALFALYFQTVLPAAKYETHDVTLKLDGKEVKMVFLDKALARLGALSPAPEGDRILATLTGKVNRAIRAKHQDGKTRVVRIGIRHSK